MKWNASGNVRFVVYLFAELKKEAIVLAVTDKTELEIKAAGHYSLSTINNENQESSPSKIVEKK